MEGASPGNTMHRFARLAVAFLLCAGTASAQQLRFDDVVRNLRNPDPKVRLSAIKLLKDAKYPEAVPPIAALVVDPVDEVQLEAIAAELSFFLDQDVRSKRMVGFLIEKRESALGQRAFDLGPYVVWPRTVPVELVDGLLRAVDDENGKVRLDAIYALGVVARTPLSAEQIERLRKALDHYDPAIRVGAARVIGRLRVPGTGEALLKAVNDSQADVRYAAMRALGAIKDESAVTALSDQLAFYKKGEGAWSALDALARIASKASIPVFRERMADKDPFIRRAAIEGLGRTGDTESIDKLETLANTDESLPVRLATVYALQRMGRQDAGRIVDLLSAKVMAQGQDYLVEIGSPVTPTVVPRLQDPDAEVREAMAEVLGVVGDASAIPALEAALKDRDPSVVAAAKRSLSRLRAL
jgi:HEAT repeat protein